jgi:hypothetical protein
MIYLISPVNVFDINGGAIVRKMIAHYMEEANYDVTIVMPGNYLGDEYRVINTPPLLFNKFFYLLECIGFLEDRYSYWAGKVVNILVKLIKTKDIVFVTTGGELSPIIVGDKLKKITGCKLIINYHDPLEFTSLGGHFSRKSRMPHVNRDNIESKYLKNADYVITSTQKYKLELQNKYPLISEKIHCCYFGYAFPERPRNSQALPHGEIINIVYGGNFGVTQSPEILAQAVKGNTRVHLYFVGKHNANKSLDSYRGEPNITFVGLMPQESYLQFLKDRIDVGFLSLKGNLSKYCVPSKLYDYINYTIPIIGVVKGDASQIIKDNNYGVVSDYSVEEVKKSIDQIIDPKTYSNCVQRLIEDHDSWSMSKKVKEILSLIELL